MNTLQIPQRGIYKEYAGAWDEIEMKDIPFIGKWLWMLESGELDVDMFRKLAVDRLINRRNSKVIPMEGDRAWDLWANEGQLADTVNFFFRVTKKESSKFLPSNSGSGSKLPSGRSKDGKEVKDTKDNKGSESGESYEVIPDFVKNIVPWVWTAAFDTLRCSGNGSGIGVLLRYIPLYGSRKLYGPGDFLGEMCFGEYKDLLFCADKYMRTKDVAWLTRMMAIAYRRRRLFLPILKRLPHFNGRTRLKYRAGAVDFSLKRFEKVPIGVKYMFFQYVMGCIYNLKNSESVEVDGHVCNFGLIFGKGRKSEDGSPESDNEDDGVGLTGVMMVLAESGVFGTIRETAEADVWDVLIRLYQLELQRREMERKMK